MIEVLLNDSWQMTQLDSENSYNVSVPTTMYQSLFDHGVIDDPFYGENDRKLTKLSDDSYFFIKEFDVSNSLMKESFIEIIFEGLDTLSTIYINDRMLGKTENMHRTYRFDIKDFLMLGNNKIRIEFDSPTVFIAKKQASDPLWGISTTMDGYEYIRKAHHMFGWDWGPQLPDMGIWRDVKIIGYSKGKIEDFYVIQKHKEGEVELVVTIDNQVSIDGLMLKVKIQDENGQSINEKEVMLQLINTEDRCQSEVTMSIKNPNLWWPNGYGEAYLYNLSIELYENDNTNRSLIDEVKKRIGLRTMTIHREVDQWGESFDFKINNHRIFAMGADYIPEDVFITRPTKDTTERLIKDCVKANYNCLRIWGGGVYPNDDFLDLCDEYGLIIWQDFMFACGVYRLTKSFEANIKAEFIDNIKRIRHHACLGLWCGNNEMEVAFVEWGLPKDERLRLDYLLMYEKLIPDILEEYDPQTFYWPASPSSGGGFNEPNADNKGDVHYWQVFHGNEHYKAFRKHYFRFASEYGMQAFPDYKTVLSYTSENQRNLFSPIMENHNKCVEPLHGNIKILLNMAGEFQIPKELEDLIYISQVFQGETIKCAVEHFRRHRGRCMGSTYWQVNDICPVASWSSIDYYGRWKAMHYMAKRFYSQILLSAYEEGLIGHIHITNDQLTTFEGKVKWQLRHIDKGILIEDESIVVIDPLSAQHVVDVDATEYAILCNEERKLYITYQLYDVKNVQLSSDSILFVFHKYFEFKKAKFKAEVLEIDNCYVIDISSNEYAKSVELKFTKIDVVLSNNFFDVLQNETKRILIDEFRIGSCENIEELNKQLYVLSVNNMSY